MSSYYMFYLAENTSEGLQVVAPAMLTKNGQFKFKPAVVRSSSFIHWEDWEEFMEYVPLKVIHDNSLDLLTSNHSWNPDVIELGSDSYACKYSTIARMADKAGLRVGYTSLNDLNYVAEHNYHLEDKYEIELYSAEMVAEMAPEDKRNYGKVAFLETNSVDYIANQLVNAFHEIVYNANDFYVVCVRG